MKTLKASETRIPPDVYNRVAYRNELVRVERRSAPAVYLISEADLEVLERARRRAAFEDAAARVERERGELLKRLAD